MTTRPEAKVLNSFGASSDLLCPPPFCVQSPTSQPMLPGRNMLCMEPYNTSFNLFLQLTDQHDNHQIRHRKPNLHSRFTDMGRFLSLASLVVRGCSTLDLHKRHPRWCLGLAASFDQLDTNTQHPLLPMNVRTHTAKVASWTRAACFSARAFSSRILLSSASHRTTAFSLQQTNVVE